MARIKILGFVLILLVVGVDFWLIKNMIGKELVGMMWWLKVNI